MINPDNIFGRLGNRMFQGAYLYAQVRKGIIPDIYIQDESYFSEFSDEIKKLYGGYIGPTIPYVSIHVRRGDYVGNYFYVQLTEDYYKQAMAVFPNKVFIVFSDDIEWCKKQDTFKDCIFSEGHSELEDMNKMASCEHNIIANSSFSWWAAWLNPNPNKKVLAPKNWFTNSEMKMNLPTSWIKI